jgi:hypothetical protein
MSLLKKNPSCPIHGKPLVLSRHGKKSNFGHYLLEVQGAPILFCPECHERGTDTSVEVESGASNAFLRRLIRLLDRFPFPDALGKPMIRVDFNPTKAAHAEPVGALAGTLSDAATTSRAAAGEPQAQPEPRPKPEPEPEPEFESFVPREPRHSLDQLVLDPDTLERIREAINVLVSQDLLYDTWNLAAVARTGRRVALNFFGPPGTGKTLAADAIAHFLDRKILIVSYAELESKYVGETPKNIRAAFRKAAETGSVLFFDEADSILGKRLTTISQSADSGLNVARSTTLIELDNFDGVAIFASNLVKNYDTAFLRRMLAHVEFRLPGPEQRQRIWECHVPSQLPLGPDVDFGELAVYSEGAAGGDIQNAVLLAASYASMRSPPERVVRAADFKRAIAFILDAKQRILE